MMNDGVFTVDGAQLRRDRLHPAPASARTASSSAATARKLYVSNRGTHRMQGGGHGGPGSISVIDFATNRVDRAPG